MPFCTSLWTRDSFINVNNKLIMLPLQSLVKSRVSIKEKIESSLSPNSNLTNIGTGSGVT